LLAGPPAGVAITDLTVAGAHGSTFDGQPVAAAAALDLLNIVSQPEFLADVQAKGLKEL
jgi:acetylornithine/succinyldiaminopimelate/putrescine aminotransferase